MRTATTREPSSRSSVVGIVLLAKPSFPISLFSSSLLSRSLVSLRLEVDKVFACMALVESSFREVKQISEFGFL